MANTLPPRVRPLASSNRILGVDLARGLAVVGMFAAHILIIEDFDWSEPGTWADIVNGRSSILFAMLAGISIAILSGGTRPKDGVPLLRARMRIVVRALLLFVLGGLLTGLGTPVYVILEYYAVLFVLALPFLRWRPRQLFLLAAVLTLVLPVLQLVLSRLYEPLGFEDAAIVELLVTGNYPAMIWIVFVLVGLGLGRLDLANATIRLRMLASGAVLAVVGYCLGALAAAGDPDAADAARDSLETASGDIDWSRAFDLTPLATLEAHSGSPFEIVGSLGFAIAVLAICLLVAQRARSILFPLIATGSMPLTAYSVQLLALFAIGASSYWVQDSDNGFLFLTLTLVIMAGCSLWALTIGTGPLEQVLKQVSQRAASIADHRTGAPPAGPVLDPDSALDPDPGLDTDPALETDPPRRTVL